MLVNGFGFSNGCAELALKKPPPLFPISLMTSCEATGPPTMVWCWPASVLTACADGEVVDHAARGQDQGPDERQRQQQPDACTWSGLPRSCPAGPSCDRMNPRTSAMAIAMPTAADTKFCTARPRHLHDVAHGGLAGVVLPVRVGGERDGGVPRQRGRDAGKAEREASGGPAVRSSPVHGEHGHDRGEREHAAQVGAPLLVGLRVDAASPCRPRVPPASASPR